MIPHLLPTSDRRVSNWARETARHLGQFQDVPSRYQIPTSGQVLAFDGTAWTPATATGPPGPPGPAGATGPTGATGATGPSGVDKTLSWETPSGTKDGANTTFTVPTISFGTNGRPQLRLIHGRTDVLWVDPATPTLAHGQWTTVDATTIKVGTPPAAIDYFIIPWMLTV